ncbi:MAG TPA: prolyl oligopeptidase family serine peptidase [Caulobacteraceae bacterium]|nr:prolyl oligopeptidase family serine peptidase [Caulobacteraceae bacterium]
MAEIRPYGSWSSPVTAASLAEGAIGVAELRVVDGRLYWLETRPAEGGRLVAMTRDGAGGARQLTPEGFNVRTRVHEYGGGAYMVAPDGLWFSNFRDQKLYRQVGDAAPQAMTPEPYRWADATPAPGGGLIAVREDHTNPADVKNAIVRLPASGGAGEMLFAESDFVAYPRVSPDGARLAWIAWDFPAMPWDETRLYVADLTDEGLANTRQVAGGADISAIDPQWGADGTLTWLSDETGWWNLYDDRDGSPRAIKPADHEFGGPLWQLGQSNYAAVAGGRILASVGEAGGDALWLIDRAGGAVTKLDLPFVALGALHAVDGTHVAMLAGGAAETSAVIVVDVESGGFELVRRPSPTTLAPHCISRAEPISFPSAGGRTAHALYYPPTNVAFDGPAGEKPPLIVQAHGGPTGAAQGSFSIGVQYWTNRGFALVDVDYGGSSGYGRAYRQLLQGEWGVVDVEDVIAAARYLADAGKVDPRRIAIHGGSAGGFTVLAALSQSDAFAAGGDFYGVADLEALARDTHKFESRYLDGLIGPWPAAKATYDARSPINHLDRFTAPLLILQGSEDPIVPPNQAYMIRDALKAKGVPVAYIEFPGEGHGFRRAENIIRAKEAELDFYGRVFGFAPADKIDPVQIENAGALHAGAPAG